VLSELEFKPKAEKVYSTLSANGEHVFVAILAAGTYQTLFNPLPFSNETNYARVVQPQSVIPARGGDCVTAMTGDGKVIVFSDPSVAGETDGAVYTYQLQNNILRLVSVLKEERVGITLFGKSLRLREEGGEIYLVVTGSLLDCPDSDFNAIYLLDGEKWVGCF